MMSRPRSFAAMLIAAVALLHLTGCSYLTNRYNDLKDIGDFGFTFTRTPQFAFYASGPFIQVGTVGYGHVNGNYFGLGEGRAVAWGPHYEDSKGLFLWGEEWVSFYHTEEEIAAMPEEERLKEANFMRVGLVGMAQGPAPGLKYFGSCPHYIHLGWVGVSGGPRYFQMIDLITGLACVDLTLDDNRDLDGRFPKENKLKEGIGWSSEGLANYFSRVVHF